MKHFLATLALLAAVAAITCVITFRLSGDPGVKAAVEQRNALEWLRTDFDLDAAQFAKIKQLHESYSLVCEDHCRAIQEAQQVRRALKASGSATPDALATADRRVEELRQICETAIAAHVRECAAHMSPAAG
ncbi:MAG TPA: hypothetical protein VEA63_15240, partial [Opitutus sp.]|nr:hypothetical protein [Opitutus sp.]